jgi:hypothetical protein
MNDNGLNSGRGGGGSHRSEAGLLGKVLTIAAGAILLIAAFMFSLLVFGALLIAGLLAWGYLWWKTRDLRTQLKRQRAGGRVIEGEAVREVGTDDDARS